MSGPGMGMIPAAAVEAAARALWEPNEHGDEWVGEFDSYKDYLRDYATKALEAAAPHMLAGILEDVANTAETDELTTAAEVVYDLRRHAKDLRPAT